MVKNKILFLLIFLCSSAGVAFAQEMIDIKTALKEIQDKYKVQFIYDDALVAGLKVSVMDHWDEKMEVKMDKLLKPLKLTYAKISAQYYVIKALSNRDEKQESIQTPPAVPAKPTSIQKSLPLRKISGFIKDENNLPAVGVTVMIKNSGIGTVSDMNGAYMLEVPENGVLVFSYIGYKTVEVPITGKSGIDLKLDIESTQIEEIVVVAYGVQKRAHLTGSVATLHSRELAQKPVDNLTTMLSGRLPGVITRQQSGVPGENAAKFFIRGRSSPTGSGAPLIIVDGVERPFEVKAT